MLHIIFLQFWKKSKLTQNNLRVEEASLALKNMIPLMTELDTLLD